MRNKYFRSVVLLDYILQITRNDPGVLVLLLIDPPGSVPQRVVDVSLADSVVELDLEEDGELPALGAVLLEVAHRHRLLVEL